MREPLSAGELALVAFLTTVTLTWVVCVVIMVAYLLTGRP